MVIKQIISTVARGAKPKITIKPSPVPKPEIAIKGVTKPSPITIKSNNATTLTGADILAEQNKAMLVTPPKITIKKTETPPNITIKEKVNPQLEQTRTGLTEVSTNAVNKPQMIIKAKEDAPINQYHALFKDCTPQKAREAERLFLAETEGKLQLHCPTTWELVHNQHSGLGGFDNGLANLVEWYKKGLLKELEEKGVKHVIVGHGDGSSINKTWRIVQTGERVPDYIRRTVPLGERCLVMCCETSGAVTGKRGVGTIVDTGLWYLDNPAKIVESGSDDIIGYFFNPCDSRGGLKLYSQMP